MNGIKIVSGLLVATAFACAIHAAEPAAIPGVTSDPNTWAEASIHYARDKHLPCYVLVGAAWCHGCKWVEKTYAVELSRGVYVHFDADRHKEPIRRFCGKVAAIPVLIVVDVFGRRRTYCGPAEIKAYFDGPGK
jgi:hypothetical protein